MKISEVPQDDIRTMQGERKALYARDEQGRYVRTPTRGWEAEEIVLHQVIDDFEVQASRAAGRVSRGETSPIEYFMLKRWMDPLTLAQAMGLYRWQVRRHFQPAVFGRLGERTIAEYARIFRVSPEALRNFRGEGSA